MPIRAHLALAFLVWLPRMPMSVRIFWHPMWLPGRRAIQVLAAAECAIATRLQPLRFAPDGVSFRPSTKEGSREVAVNVQGFEQLKRVLSSVPEGQLDMTNWNSCACGQATRDEWFRSQGLTTCTDFPTAAAFF